MNYHEFLLAVKNNDLHSIKQFLKFENINIIDALIISAEKGYLDIIKLLVEYITTKNIQWSKAFPFKYFLTEALVFSAQNNKLDVVKYLVAVGADINGNNNYYNDNPLFVSAERGYLDIVKFLIDNNVNIHTYLNNDGPFMYSAMNGHYDIAKLLLENGANIHAGNDYIKYTLVGEKLWKEYHSN